MVAFVSSQHRERFVAKSALPADHSAHTARRPPPAARRPPPAARRPPHTAHRTPHTAHRTPHTAHRFAAPKEKAPEGAFKMLRLVRQAD
ncbi:hypothetical protein [Burkholderia sp. BCC1974]|uniref:hypothetical protein n=1 Tax=Burkholderia sp. BCC1974 TaxID=2817439 RepID=UPI002ABDB7AD|nr:hypothetical protein [Burkholderia sp. BCC1974]